MRLVKHLSGQAGGMKTCGFLEGFGFCLHQKKSAKYQSLGCNDKNYIRTILAPFGSELAKSNRLRGYIYGYTRLSNVPKPNQAKPTPPDPI